ncbi:MAG: class I SAM-dependent methyltransferase [Elusimicrobia bacterium]|nr:class I SAM-dependent methyltransferase [Elusimicrobiota bacterium]
MPPRAPRKPSAAVSPERIFEAFNAYQRTEALRAAIELDLFTAIDEGGATPAELSARLTASERGLRVLCDYLTILGLLSKDGARYALAPDAAVFLSRKSPACLASVARFLGAPRLMDGFRRLGEAVRRGGTVLDDGAGTTAPEHPVWVDFARAMAPMMAAPAEAIADLLDVADAPRLRVLDVAAGHGLFGLALARRCPRATVVALDWPQVLEVALENARAAGAADRYERLPGSAFDADFGTGYDVILLTNFLHHFDAPANEALLRKVRAALAPKGRAVVLEFVPNPDRVSPPAAAAFSLTMLSSTPSGDAYTFAELERMLKNAGFARAALHGLGPSPQSAIVAEA